MISSNKNMKFLPLQNCLPRLTKSGIGGEILAAHVSPGITIGEGIALIVGRQIPGAGFRGRESCLIHFRVCTRHRGRRGLVPRSIVYGQGKCIPRPKMPIFDKND